MELEVRLEEVIGEVDARRAEIRRRDEPIEERLRVFAFKDVGEERQALRVLGEDGVRRVRGEEPALRVEKRRRDCGLQPRGLRAPVRGEVRIPHRILHLRCALQSGKIEEVQFSVRAAFARTGRPSALPARTRHPVHERPAGQVFEKAIRTLVEFKAAERVAHPRKARAQPVAIRVAHHVVGIHAEVAERVGGSLLHLTRREVERHAAVVAAVEVVNLNRAADERIIGRHRRNDIQLHTRVAGVHLLLVEGTVEEHFVAAHLHRPHGDALHVGERRIVGSRERRLADERIAALDERQVFDRDGFRARLNEKFAPPSATEPRRLEDRAGASVEDKGVAEAPETLAFPFASVALVRFLVARILRGRTQRLGPAPRHLSALATRHDGFGVGADVTVEIPADAPRLTRRHREGELHLAARHKTSRPHPVFGLIRKLRGVEHPALSASAVDVPLEDRMTHDGGRSPLLGLRIKEPSPRQLEGVARCEVAIRRALTARTQNALQRTARPRAPSRRERSVIDTLGLEAEAEAVGKLRKRRGLADLPDDGLHHVRPCRERHAVALVGPIIHRTAMRSACDELPVQREIEALVRRHVEDERRTVGREDAAEAHDARRGDFCAFLREVGMREPRRRINRLHGEDVCIPARHARRAEDPLHVRSLDCRPAQERTGAHG